MRQSNIKPAARQLFGVVRYVDTINRELHVQIGAAVIVLDVPRDCTIYLHGERVKLRMLQPLDRVRATCKNDDNPFAVRVLEVQPD